MGDELQHDLAAVLAKHADRLDGRTWQRTTQLLAEGYFEQSDLMALFDADELGRALAASIDALPDERDGGRIRA